MGKMFGTDGIRGVAGRPPFVPATIRLVGRAIAHACRRTARRPPTILIGRDTRASGPAIEEALSAGIRSAGANVFLAGIVPTPAVALLTRMTRANAGIVVSASHNPWRDNGIKVFSSRGSKLSDAGEARIESLIARPSPERSTRTSQASKLPFDASRTYVDFCLSTWPAGLDLRGTRLVLDCANGATSYVAPAVFTALGAAVAVMNNTPNGRNINERCGSEHTASLVARVLSVKADAGLAFDGDGDRLMGVDARGRVLTGDHILAICAASMKKERRLRRNRVVFTAMSNMGLRLALDRMNIRWSETGVGDRHIAAELRRTGACLGGEESGHIVFTDFHTTGDGIIAALQLLAVAAKTGRPLAQLADVVTILPQTFLNVDTPSKPPLDTLPLVQSAIREASSTLGKTGRILVRYSGTQPLCRVMVEARHPSLARRLAEEIAAAIRRSVRPSSRVRRGTS